jgi:hypothetical protein
LGEVGAPYLEIIGLMLINVEAVGTKMAPELELRLTGGNGIIIDAQRHILHGRKVAPE